MRRKVWMSVAVAILLVPAARAQNAPQPAKPITAGSVLAALGGGSVDALAGSLRGFLIRAMPTPLYEDVSHWGLQKPVSEVRWRGKGLHVHAEKGEVPKNDGRWWKVRVTGDRLPDTLVFDLRDAAQPEPGRMTFTAFISFDTHVEFDRQVWHTGIALDLATITSTSLMCYVFFLCCERPFIRARVSGSASSPAAPALDAVTAA